MPSEATAAAPRPLVEPGRPAGLSSPGSPRPGSRPADAPRRADHLRVVAPARRRRRAGVVVVVVFLGLFGSSVGAVAFQAQLAENQLVLDRLDRDYRAELRDYDVLRARLAELQSPSYVLPIAERYGWRRANPVFLTPSEAAVVAVTAAVGARAGLPGDGMVRPDWTTVKPLVGAAP
ncbi:MAG: hypothetical protein ACKO91_02750 [Acidimicrobiales bacterium]